MPSNCPYCGEEATDAWAEIAHMEAHHPEIIRERREKAGYRDDPVPHMTNNFQLSHKQLVTMARKTRGYKKQHFTFWVSAQHLVYLTVINVVYVIDADGNVALRRKSDGSGMGNEPYEGDL
jgi:hypothetical protein